MVEKPKTSTIESLSEIDLILVNKLIISCKDLYFKTAYPHKPGPHTNPQDIDDTKAELLRLALRVGERVWFPRGKDVGRKRSNKRNE